MSPGSRPSPPSPPVFQITAPRNEVSRSLPSNGNGGNHQHDADDEEQLSDGAHEGNQNST
jgi:hypothetical protein